MNTAIKKYLSILGVVLSVFGLTSNAVLASSNCTSATMINSLPYTIVSPGTYCLANNMTFITSYNSSISAISISSSNVTVDLNGKTITGRWANNTPGIGRESGILVGGRSPQDVIVRNGTLKGFLGGVTVSTNSGSNNVKRLTVENMTITDMVYSGISYGGNSRCDYCTVRNNIITNIDPSLRTNGGAFVGAIGIAIGESDNLDIHDNFIFGLKSHGPAHLLPSLPSRGIRLVNCDNALIDNNTISNLPSTVPHIAIDVTYGGTNNRMQNNSLNHFYYGIKMPVRGAVYSGTSYTNVTVPYTGGTDGGGNQ